MAPRIAYKQRRRPTFFKQWRIHRGLSQDRLAERLETSTASVSRIEKGVQPYTQDYLEALADALQTEPSSLLMRDPTAPDPIWTLWERAKQAERKDIEDYAKYVIERGQKTGNG